MKVGREGRSSRVVASSVVTRGDRSIVDGDVDDDDDDERRDDDEDERVRERIDVVVVVVVWILRASRARSRLQRRGPVVEVEDVVVSPTWARHQGVS